jgi:hypothetical protein
MHKARDIGAVGTQSPWHNLPMKHLRGYVRIVGRSLTPSESPVLCRRADKADKLIVECFKTGDTRHLAPKTQITGLCDDLRVPRITFHDKQLISRHWAHQSYSCQKTCCAKGHCGISPFYLARSGLVPAREGRSVSGPVACIPAFQRHSLTCNVMQLGLKAAEIGT